MKNEAYIDLKAVKVVMNGEILSMLLKNSFSDEQRETIFRARDAAFLFLDEISCIPEAVSWQWLKEFADGKTFESASEFVKQARKEYDRK